MVPRLCRFDRLSFRAEITPREGKEKTKGNHAKDTKILKKKKTKKKKKKNAMRKVGITVIIKTSSSRREMKEFRHK